jgi:hypothetical protein
MVDGKHGDLIWIEAVENTIRKATDQHAPHARVDLGARPGQVADVVERRFHAQHELLAQPLPFPLLPRFGLREIPFGLRCDD